MNAAVTDILIPGLPEPKRGKVRNIYDLGEELLIVSTDRISAFDWVLPTGIPDKGRVLNGLSVFWLTGVLGNILNHFISDNIAEILEYLPAEARGIAPVQDLLGRSMLVRKMNVIPVECVVRGYLAGSAWMEYQHCEQVLGHLLPVGLTECAKLATPIFTPAIKSASGHDVNVTRSQMRLHLEKECGLDPVASDVLAAQLEKESMAIYRLGSQCAEKRGLILADTKFEFGLTPDNGILLIDEVFTPDSSRYWLADEYEPGHNQPSLDKQFVRDWLTCEARWDKNSPPPELPDDVVTKTRERYVEAFERLTNQPFPWK